MALVFKKVTEYKWDVTVNFPDNNTFRKETFTAVFKNISRKSFDKLIESGDENFIKTILVNWHNLKDTEGNDIVFNQENLEAVIDDTFIAPAIITAYGDSIKGASEKN
tara:strand:- start:219 stop:542 length:324 start_codon:yes stop_codon:yes gene_type:complete